MPKGRLVIDRQRGFTLIELLVVISIIALLMSILMPALARTRRQAKAVVCKLNLKQWGAMFAMYANDNEGNFFQNLGWWSALRPYYSGQNDIRLCPTATKPVKRGQYGAGVFGAWVKGGAPGSYGMNSSIPNSPGHGTSYWRRDDVKGAPQVPVLLDAQWVAGWPWWKDDPPAYKGA
ncbi:MAG: type II secretion system protein [Planctomycetota bacterium]|jgi:prepilin-type N-terminal cleavage/methylation domain-containing protein